MTRWKHTTTTITYSREQSSRNIEHDVHDWIELHGNEHRRRDVCEGPNAQAMKSGVKVEMNQYSRKHEVAETIFEHKVHQLATAMLGHSELPSGQEEYYTVDAYGVHKRCRQD